MKTKTILHTILAEKLKKTLFIALLISVTLSQETYAQTDTSFWFAQPDVWRRNTSLVIRYCFTTYEQPANVTIMMPADSNFTPISFSIPANSFYVQDVTTLTNSMMTSTINTVLDKGIHISTSAPVSCYWESTGDNGEIYCLKGYNALGHDFLVPMQAHYGNHTSFYRPSRIEFVATEDNTIVELTPSTSLQGSVGSGQTLTVNLNRGQSYVVKSIGCSSSEHLYNTLIHSTKPIAVNSTDDLVAAYGNADLVGDQIVPINLLGKKYLAIKNNSNNERISIFATQPNTTVTINGSSVTLSPGQVHDQSLTNTATYIISDKPIAVFQVTASGSELGGTMLPHLECTGSRTVRYMRSDGSISTYATIVVKTAAVEDFLVNGNPNTFSSSQFNTLSYDPSLSYAIINVSNLVNAGEMITVENTSDLFLMGTIDMTNIIAASCSYGVFSDYSRIAHIQFLMSSLYNEGDDIYFNFLAPNTNNLVLTCPNGAQVTSFPFILTNVDTTATGWYYMEGVDTSGCNNLIGDSIFIYVVPSFRPDSVGNSLCSNVIVASGTTTNSNIPINGSTGNNLQRSQSIYPSEILTDLIGKRIDSLHYSVNSGNFDGGDWTISIGVTRWQMLQFTFDNVSELTEVYHGPLNANDSNGLGIKLDSAFAFAGGNLIIQFVQHTPSESSSCTFLGSYTSGSTSRRATTYSGNIMSQGGLSDYFLPEVTFHACADSTIDTSHVSTGVALPYCENFDNYATGEGHMPLYWQGHNTLSIDMGRYPLVTNEYNSSPGNSLGMHIMGNNTCYAVLPDFALDSLRHLNLSFMVRNKPTEQGILVIGVLPDTNDLNSFQPLDTIIPPGDHWMPVTYSFQNYQGTARRVAFLDRPRQGYSFSNIYIDDFIADTWIYPTVQHYGAQGVRVIAPESHSANYWLEYGEQGFVPGYDSSIVMHVTTSPFYITDLSSETTYDFYFYPMLDSNTVVRSTCRNPLYITNCISRFDTTVTTCNSYSWHNHTYTSSGNYMDTLTITTGCDSIITLHLTINHNDSVALNISACDNYTWDVDGITYFSDTTLSASLPTNNGCDSLILLHLTILPSPQLQHIPDTVINLGQSLTLHAHGADMFTWSDADGVLLCNDSIITVNPATSTVYYLTAFNQGNNLVYNGDFELGNTGFTSAYTYNTNLNPEGRYYIGSNAHNYHYGFTGASDHTSGSGNFMIVNGSGTAGTNLWTQTVTVQPYTNYAFSVWGTNVSSYSQQYMAKLQFCINGTQIGDIFQLPTPMNTWTQFYEVWNSGPNTTATITILNMNTLLGGNDFGIDDISFSSLTTCQSNDTINVFVGHHIDSNVCASQYPFMWNGETFLHSGAKMATLSAINGTDSIVIMNAITRPEYHISTIDTICENTHYLFHGQLCDTSGQYTHIQPTVYGCDSLTILQLIILDTNSVDTIADVCNQLLWHGVTYTTNGSPEYQTTNVHGCDSTITLHLTVRRSTTSTDFQTACDTFTWIDGNKYSASGTTTHILTNTAGCDSIITLNLTIRHSSIDTDTHTACDTYTWIDGNTYTTSNNSATYTLNNTDGCDSIVTLALTINHANTGTETVTACNSFVWHGTEYSESTTMPTHASTNSAGCDSVTTLHLTINHCSTTTITACDNYSWHGNVYTSSGVYTIGTDTLILTINISSISTETVTACNSYSWHGNTYSANNNTATHTETNALGCDSTVTLNLTINYSNTGDTSATACDEFSWYGTNYNTSTTPPLTLTNVAGCDSTVTLHLTINHSNNATIDTVACNSFVWHGTEYTASTTTPTHTDINAAGCDSVTTLHLTINHCSTTTITVCDSYLWNGNIYTESGTYIFGEDTLNLTINHSSASDTSATVCDSIIWYGTVYTVTSSPTHTLTNTMGCDSVETLYLTVNHSNSITETITACDTLIWHGVAYTTSNNTDFHIETNAAGCDSIITLNLTVNYSNTGIETVTTCDSYSWHGITYTDNNSTAKHTGINVAGCDSITTLHLTLNHSNAGVETVTACDTFIWHGNTYTSNNSTATYTETNSAGCDSIITLNLTINYSTTGDTTITDCDSISWNGTIYTSSQDIYPITYLNSWGCDSLVTLHLTVNVSTSQEVNEAACYSFEWPTASGQLLTSSGKYRDTSTNAVGCDSVTTLNLIISRCLVNSDTACDNYIWHGNTYTSSGVYTDNLDTLELTILNSSMVIDTQTACDTFTWIDGRNYTSSNDTTTIVLTNVVGCDSIIALHLTLHHSVSSIDTIAACDSVIWIDGVTYNTSDSLASHNLTTTTGCDSTVTLHLTLHHSTQTTLYDTICHDQNYTWNGYTFHSDNHEQTESIHFSATLNTIYGCDSMANMIITKMAQPQIHFDSNKDCHTLSYTLTAIATAPLSPDAEPQPMPYLLWSSSPDDPLLHGQENNPTILVSPHSVTEYTLYADYKPTPMCPVSANIILRPLVPTKAELKIVPEALDYGHPDFTAYDISHHQEVERTWYLDWQQQSETGNILSSRADIDADSIIVALTLDNNICRDTAVAVIPIHRVAIFAPNVFTPLEDNNNRFVISCTGIIDADLYIYNREGLLIYHTTDFEQGWDGHNTNGTLCPQGAYVWRIYYHAENHPKKLQTKVGTILLLK